LGLVTGQLEALNVVDDRKRAEISRSGLAITLG
jgi:hypothetical protein